MDAIHRLQAKIPAEPCSTGTSDYRQRSNYMLTDKDVERCAMGMLEDYGANAAFHAHRRVDAALSHGATTIAAIWSDVAAEIEALQGNKAKTEEEKS